MELLAGPLAVISEKILLGHCLESIKMRKQISGMSYSTCFRRQLNRGYLHGYFPYGLIQSSVKGAPVLFVQNNLSNYHPFVTGLLSGVAQGICVTPLQRYKTLIVTKNLKLLEVIKHNPFVGILPMICRRSLDWGCRSLFINKYETNKWNQLISIVKGCFISNIVTMPFDFLLTNKQSELRAAGAATPLNGTSLTSIRKQIHTNPGILYRGFCIRMLDSTHHTAWLLIFGNILVDTLNQFTF